MGLPGVHIEVKCVEQLNVPGVMAKAIRDAARFGGVPGLFRRRSRSPWLVTMQLTDWLELYERVTTAP